MARTLNHPHFGDVAKTTYRKGVITDFSVVSQAPFQVASLVKVTGDWGNGEKESDYIPLFYRPKEHYWDGNFGILATDYVESGGYYEKAWMSFRCDDEVKVMVKDGTPTAVVGFYDGVPRVGEDIVKLYNASRPERLALFQCSKLKVYFLGADLTLPATSPYGPIVSSEQVGPDGADLRLVAPQLYTIHLTDAASSLNYFEVFFVVGPILYIVQNFAKTGEYGYINVRAGLYSAKLLNQLKSLQGNPEQISNTMQGIDYPETFRQLSFENMIYAVQCPTATGTITWLHDALVTAGNVRPHTKAELQQANMWPG